LVYGFASPILAFVRLITSTAKEKTMKSSFEEIMQSLMENSQTASEYAALDHATTEVEKRIANAYTYTSIEEELEQMSETLPFTDETVVSHDNPLFLN
jgi:hypothetical protein